MKVRVPHNFKRREYQEGVFNARKKGIDRIIQVWHRRAGKDLTDLHLTVCEMVKRVGNYWHVYPYYGQARRAIWEGITSEGIKYLDAFPKELIKKIDQQTMKIEFINGSTWRLVGADKPDSLVGAGICGAVFSEYSLMKPTVLDLIEPMLLETKGWALFNFTPRGKNHAYDLMRAADGNEKWHISILTIDDTDVISDEQIESLRKRNVQEELIQQEYYCSFNASVAGAYYCDCITRAEDENRFKLDLYNEDNAVTTVWDIGASDAVSIWFVQYKDGFVRLVDFEEYEGKDPKFWMHLLNEKGYLYDRHIMPHDANNKRFTVGMQTVRDMFDKLGLRDIEIQPRTNSVQDDIHAVRMNFNKCIFDSESCKYGISALKHYHKKYDEDKNIFSDKPEHDWSSHASDAFRYVIVDYYRNYKIIDDIRRPETGITFNDLMSSSGKDKRFI